MSLLFVGRQPKRAGVYLLGTDGELPPHSTIYMETACGYDEPFDVHPFAYRAHAHGAGKSSLAGHTVHLYQLCNE